MLAENGAISITTLIVNNRSSDKCLEMMLKKASGVAPRNISQLQAVLDELGMPAKYSIAGNMAFIYCGPFKGKALVPDPGP